MRKLSKLAFIIFVPIVLGVGLIVSGNYFRNDAVAQAGRFVLSIGIPVTAISIGVVGIILIVTGKASDVKGPDGSSLFQNAQADFGGSDGAQDIGEEAPCKDDAPSPAEAESERLEEINSARGYESQLKYEQYQMDHSAEAYRLSDKKSRVKGWLLLGFLLTCFVLVLVFAFFRLYVGAIVCGGLFAGTIIISIISIKIIERSSMRSKVNPDKYDRKPGIVRGCIISSSSSTGGGNTRSTVRVTSVTYRVIVTVDGKDYNAYSRQYYGAGEKLAVYVRKNGKGNAVIAPKTAEEEAEEQKAFEEELARREERVEELERELVQRYTDDEN